MKKKLVMYLQGRLGNQLFEVATGYHYAIKNGFEFYVRESDVSKWPGFEQNPPNCYNRYHDIILSRFQMFDSSCNENFIKIEENSHQDFIDIPPNFPHNLYLFGIWQSSQYFPDYELIRSKLNMNEQIRSQLTSNFDFDNSVGISIRRGDYMKFTSDVVVPLMSWYIDVCNQFFPGKKYIISSDSIDWCRENFTLPNAQFIDFGAEKNLFILSLCKDHIVSNSTFSWWTAFLNERSDSITIHPDRFWVKPNLCYRDNFYQKNWIPYHISDDQYEK